MPDVGNESFKLYDPFGLITFVIGGANDENTRVMRNFEEDFRDNHPNEKIIYLSHSEAEEMIPKLIEQYLSEKKGCEVAAGEAGAEKLFIPGDSGKINIVAHSWGADAAIRLALKGLSVDALVTFDPVQKTFPAPPWGLKPPSLGEKPPNVGTWINIHQSLSPADFASRLPYLGTPLGILVNLPGLVWNHDFGNYIASAGGQIGKIGGATNQETKRSHQDVENMYKDNEDVIEKALGFK